MEQTTLLPRSFGSIKFYPVGVRSLGWLAGLPFICNFDYGPASIK
jgi:hypothetical protein